MLFRVACTRLSHERGKRYELSACQSHDNYPTYSGRNHLISLVPFRTRLQRYRAGLSARGSNGAGVASFQTRNNELHGFEIGENIQRVSGDILQVEEGSLYPALQRMLMKGWLTAEWGKTAENRRARYYRLTK
jgi:hypothetical protein